MKPLSFNYTMSVCRVCLCSAPEKNIDQLVINDEELGYEKIMLFCLDIQIVKDSQITSKLCTNCFEKIIEFHQFKYLALKNDAHLQSLALRSVKCEDLSTDVEEESLQYTEFHRTESPCYDEGLIVKKEGVEEEAVCEPAQITYEYLEMEVKEPATRKRKQLEEKTTKKRKKPKGKHTNIKSEICPECGKVVKNLKHHSMIHFPLEKRDTYECDLCDKVFQTIRGKKVHIIARHTADAKKQCNLCNVAVLNLRQHIRTVHEPEARTLKCVSCDKKFITRSTLNAHLSTHTNDKPFVCDLCEQSFRTKQQMIRHKRRLHNKEKSYVCDICAKSFFKKESLVTHIRIHTREKPYKCPDCDKSFISSSTLKNHRYTHGKQEFKCTHCDRSFYAPKYLRAHLKTHKKEKRYPCRYCPVAFYRSDHRKRHEMTAHNKVVLAPR